MKSIIIHNNNIKEHLNEYEMNELNFLSVSTFYCKTVTSPLNLRLYDLTSTNSLFGKIVRPMKAIVLLVNSKVWLF